MSTPTAPRPGMLLCLLQATPSMLRAFREGKTAKLNVARRGIDFVLSELVRRAAGDDPRLAGLGVGVVAYSADADGVPAFTPVVAGCDREPHLVPLAELDGRSLGPRADGPPRWVDSRSCLELAERPAGEGLAGAAMAFATHLTTRWLARNRDAFPPVVLHFTDGDAADEALSRAGRSLRLLAALGHFVFWEKVGSATGGRPLAEDSPLWRLYDLASPAPAPDDPPDADRRALWINAPPWKAVERLLWPVAELTTLAATGEPLACRTRPLWYVKKGNAEEEWEDAFAVDEAAGVVAVCDGASEGIFARRWARLLTTAFVRDQPDAENLPTWLARQRAAWLADISGGQPLRWSQQAKVDRDGASATLVAWRLEPAGDAPRWRAWAVGDSCLFWVRDGRLLASFPVAAARHFVVGPALLRTLPGVPPAPVMASGDSQPGDLFFLATDAVAQELLRRVETNDPPDWNQLEAADEGAWRLQIDSLREQRQMVNDDCTLVAVRVIPAAAPAAPP